LKQIFTPISTHDEEIQTPIEVKTTVTTTEVRTMPLAIETHTYADMRSSRADTTDVTVEPAKFETFERAPVIQEVILPREREEFQQVIHREIERPEIHRITENIHEEFTKPLQVHEVTVAPVYHEENKGFLGTITDSFSKAFSTWVAPLPATEHSTTKTEPAVVERIVQEPIIHTTIKPHIIEEVQPVIHRTIYEPHLVKERQDVYEKIIEKPVIVNEVKTDAVLTTHTNTGHTIFPADVKTTNIETTKTETTRTGVYPIHVPAL